VIARGDRRQPRLLQDRQLIVEGKPDGAALERETELAFYDVAP
jgi:hypothetical protein